MPIFDVLVIGSGAREHALCWALRNSPSVGKIIAAPGNPGIAEIAECVSIAVTDADRLGELAADRSVGLAVVGPEAALEAGIADRLRDRAIPVFGPTRAAAELEWSKAFAKQFMADNAIPTAAFSVHDDLADALAAVRRIEGPVVIKADGLAAGKGVFVCHSRAEAESAIQRILGEDAFGTAGSRVLIEECLSGPELSVIAICDGERFLRLPSARDHKRLLEGDRGPNTGGMGAFAPATTDLSLLQDIDDRVFRPTLAAMARIGRPFTGALFAGLMLTPVGPQVLEFNCRFGDPETQVLLPLLEGDLALAFLGAAEGELDPEALTVRDSAAAGIVMAAAGYPENPRKGDPISGLDQARDLGALVFHAGTRSDGDDVITNGGRVLTVVGEGPTIDNALAVAYSGVDAISFPGMQFRRDIAHTEVLKR